MSMAGEGGWATEWIKKALLEVQDYVRMCIAAAIGSVTRPFYARDVMEQIELIGLGSLTVVLLTGFFTGAVLALQSGMTLDQFGARPFVGRLISASMIKELGPVLTALMLAGRVGSGIAAELGSMVVTEQISALRALGTDPIRKLVVPRVHRRLHHVPDPDRRGQHAWACSADGSSRPRSCACRRASTGARWSRACSCRTSGWG